MEFTHEQISEIISEITNGEQGFRIDPKKTESMKIEPDPKSGSRTSLKLFYTDRSHQQSPSRGSRGTPPG